MMVTVPRPVSASDQFPEEGNCILNATLKLFGRTIAPTHNSRPGDRRATSENRISNLESILLNPINSSDQGVSTRAVRGDTDGNSSLPTSVTSATMASTVLTATTRGESIGVTRISSREDAEETGVLRSSAMRSNSDDMSEERSQINQARAPRSRSHSPLTVQSAATGNQSVASASLGPSILSTAAVAPSRSFGTRRANAAASIANAEVSGHQGGSRSMADRVVSFTSTSDQQLAGDQQHPQQENDGGGDSITMPDELDNLSDIADAFSNSARAWREEYESRLDAIQKRMGN